MLELITTNNELLMLAGIGLICLFLLGIIIQLSRVIGGQKRTQFAMDVSNHQLKLLRQSMVSPKPVARPTQAAPPAARPTQAAAPAAKPNRAPRASRPVSETQEFRAVESGARTAVPAGRRERASAAGGNTDIFKSVK